ncbi:MAG: glutamate-1-semialdehyde-2,1-aminomutase [Polyangiaceae bacterium UTPRO1]|jgi:glutamate-1-semialdehyde 2,1-aminomutase|nr:glutamate-1-semialdehyde 2,1-aminomutase [Myxococcales bacterium]OQY67655.1 MAG: glutamate-1-semialdehyde-2,1-aminomutase [Polyangiaceae bacterium UTPRO1]
MTLSTKLYDEASRLFPGGVNSPVRAWRNVQGRPLFIMRASGATVVDVDGRSYRDFVGSWGAAITGHAHPAVVSAVHRAASNGLGYGAPTLSEITLARMIVEAMPSIERIRMVNSGTEATMSAIRVARAYTGRPKILKFAGCYHGHSDGLLARAGSGTLTFGMPDSAGVPEAIASHTLVATYNSDEAAAYLHAYGNEIAAVIVEPIAANMGVVPPRDGFLQGLRETTRAAGTLLIFDEVISGFRVGRGGAQAMLGVQPDLTCLGKIIGGGLPVGAFGGRADVMDLLAPLGPVYQAGTLSGNPVTMAAGTATLSLLDERAYNRLDKMGAWLASALADAILRAGIPGCVQRVGSMFTIFFGIDAPASLAAVQRADHEAFRRFFFGMLDRGFYLPPSPFEASFLSLAHSDEDLEAFVAAVRDTLRIMQ